MLFDVVQEVKIQAETLVPSRFKLVEGEVECLKQGLKVLSDDVNQRLRKLQQFALDSVLDAAVSGYANTLKEWTGKATATIVYDSNICPFTDECLFMAVKGKPNVAVVATTADGDVFGGFFSVALTEQDKWFKDPNMFIFSFESHGRCKTPQRFVVKDGWKEYACVFFSKNDSFGQFIWFSGGYGSLYLGNEKSDTYCRDMSNGFEGIERTTLTGKDRERFTCCRLVAIQLE